MIFHLIYEAQKQRAEDKKYKNTICSRLDSYNNFFFYHKNILYCKKIFPDFFVSILLLSIKLQKLGFDYWLMLWKNSHNK